MTAPLIGITTWKRRFDTELGLGRPIHTLGIEYAEPIQAQGATVALLPPAPNVSILGRLDGLVIPGGRDVNPTRYGAAPEPDTDYDTDHDAYEIALLGGARERGLPVLALCRGMQVANVAFGGTLIVDIDESADHRVTKGPAQLLERHPIALDPTSRLASLYGTEHLVNTIHHQAIDVIAPGFRAVAWTRDGIIEAIEPESDWQFWGVQWHPEKMTQPSEAAAEQALFAAFVSAAQERAAGTPAEKKGKI